MNPMIVYDIETQNWDQFVLGGLYDGEKVEIFDHEHERDYLYRILARPGEIYAHNGGRFDHLWLLDARKKYGITRPPARVIATTAGIIAVNIGDRRFLDTYRILPFSLDKLSGGRKGDLSRLCRCGTGCGGYCAVRRDMTPETRRQVAEYLALDLKLLWEVIERYQGFADANRIKTGPTLASTAWRTLKTDLGVGPSPFVDHYADWEYYRRGYYGGRTEIFATESRAGWVIDRNSTYPAALCSLDFPTGGWHRAYRQTAGKAYRSGKHGVYSARVEVPQMIMPPLPVKRRGRNFYPTGIVHGEWTNLELDAAEAGGCRIIEVTHGIYFDRSERAPLKPYFDRMFDLRISVGKKTIEGEWVKFLLNSPSGKFGAKGTFSNVIIDPEADRVKICQCGELPCRCGGYSPVDTTGRVFMSSFRMIADYAHVEWAAHLTAGARINLREQAGDAEDLIYCDTDSLFTEDPRKDHIGLALGEWKIEGEYRNLKIIAPKTYAYDLESGDEWKTVHHTKGIPLSDESWAKVLRGEPVSWQSMAGIRRPMEGRFFAMRRGERTVTPHTGARIAVKNERWTRAPTMEEIERRDLWR